MDIESTLRQAISAAKAGRTQEARRLLETVLDADERNEQAWLWMSDVVDGDEERIICLENVLTVNPHNQVAREALAALGVAPVSGQPAPPQGSQAASMAPIDPPATSRTRLDTAHAAVHRSSTSDRRPFIIITVILVMMLICTVVSILAFVVLSPVG